MKLNIVCHGLSEQAEIPVMHDAQTGVTTVDFFDLLDLVRTVEPKFYFRFDPPKPLKRA